MDFEIALSSLSLLQGVTKHSGLGERGALECLFRFLESGARGHHFGILALVALLQHCDLAFELRDVAAAVNDRWSRGDTGNGHQRIDVVANLVDLFQLRFKAEAFRLCGRELGAEFLNNIKTAFFQAPSFYVSSCIGYPSQENPNKFLGVRLIRRIIARGGASTSSSGILPKV